MLKHEFEELIGYKVTDEIYTEANAIYINAVEMTKEDFCKEWLKIGNSPLVQALSESVNIQRKAAGKYHEAIENRNAEIDALKSKVEQTAGELLEICRDSERVHDEIVRLLGHREVLRMMIERHLPLWCDDYDELSKIFPAY